MKTGIRIAVATVVASPLPSFGDVSERFAKRERNSDVPTLVGLPA
jgi:hypothetical protein